MTAKEKFLKLADELIEKQDFDEKEFNNIAKLWFEHLYAIDPVRALNSENDFKMGFSIAYKILKGNKK